MTTTLQAIQQADQDFEWYPTTQRMIQVVAGHIPTRTQSIMDIGAGDGRVLVELAKRCDNTPKLYAIEKSTVLVQAQPEQVTPVGTDLFEQNLACLSVDYIFCNPPYSQYEQWVCNIIEGGHAKKAFLVIPRRWAANPLIADALKRRGAHARTLHSDDFLDAERRARAVIDIVEISYPKHDRRWEEVKDPFNIWFDQHIDTFDREEELSDDAQRTADLARLNKLRSIAAMVAAFDEEYARMEANYRKIFELDYELLRELGVNKDNVREGIKKRMAGLKSKYWHVLFERLDTITNRLSTSTKAKFLERLTGQTSIAFTAQNAYAVVLWAIKHANRYYDEQLVHLFKDLSTFDGVLNYKSNQRVWKREEWRFRHYDVDGERPNRYALDYRFVVSSWQAIGPADGWEYPGGLHKGRHELIADVTAVLYNLGYAVDDAPSLGRMWQAGQWQDFCLADERVLFQVKAHKNGNLHFRFMPETIKAINVEAGRLLGWLKGPGDVVSQLGYTADEAAQFYGASLQINPSNVKLLTAEEARQ